MPASTVEHLDLMQLTLCFNGKIKVARSDCKLCANAHPPCMHRPNKKACHSTAHPVHSMKKNLVEICAAKGTCKPAYCHGRHLFAGTDSPGHVLGASHAHKLVAISAGDVPLVTKRCGHFYGRAGVNVARPLPRSMNIHIVSDVSIAGNVHFRASAQRTCKKFHGATLCTKF